MTALDPTNVEAFRTVQAEDATGPLTVDGDGTAMWVANDLAGDTTLVAWRGEGVETVGILEHPRFIRLFWTREGLMGSEISLAEFGGAVPPDAIRLVRLIALEGTFDTQGETAFDPAVIDIAPSFDPRTIATATTTGDTQVVSVEGALGGSRVAANGVRFVDPLPELGLVGYLGGDGSYHLWTIATATDVALDAYWASTSAVSSGGMLALATLGDAGPTGDVCVLALTP